MTAYKWKIVLNFNQQLDEALVDFISKCAEDGGLCSLQDMFDSANVTRSFIYEPDADSHWLGVVGEIFLPDTSEKADTLGLCSNSFLSGVSHVNNSLVLYSYGNDSTDFLCALLDQCDSLDSFEIDPDEDDDIEADLETRFDLDELLEESVW